MKTSLLICLATFAATASTALCGTAAAPASPAPTTNEDTIAHLLNTNWGLTLDVKSQDGGGVGLDFKLDPFPEGGLESYGVLGDTDWGLGANFKAEGFLGFPSKHDDSSPRALDVEGNLFVHAIVAEFAGQDWWVNFGISAFQLEADQNFDQVNYVFRPYVLLPVPGSHLLSKFVRHLFGGADEVTNTDGKIELAHDRPIFLRAGYDFVSEIKGDNGRKAEDRTELGVTWRIKVIGKTTFDSSYRYFFENSQTYSFLELKLSIPVMKDVALIAKYVDGKLPPSLAAGQTVSGGLSITF